MYLFPALITDERFPDTAFVLVFVFVFVLVLVFVSVFVFVFVVSDSTFDSGVLEAIVVLESVVVSETCAATNNSAFCAASASSLSLRLASSVLLSFSC